MRHFHILLSALFGVASLTTAEAGLRIEADTAATQAPAVRLAGAVFKNGVLIGQDWELEEEQEDGDASDAGEDAGAASGAGGEPSAADDDEGRDWSEDDSSGDDGSDDDGSDDDSSDSSR